MKLTKKRIIIDLIRAPLAGALLFILYYTSNASIEAVYMMAFLATLLVLLTALLHANKGP